MKIKELIVLLKDFDPEDKVKIIIGEDWDGSFIVRNIISLQQTKNIVLIKKET